MIALEFVVGWEKKGEKGMSKEQEEYIQKLARTHGLSPSEEEELARLIETWGDPHVDPRKFLEDLSRLPRRLKRAFWEWSKRRSSLEE